MTTGRHRAPHRWHSWVGRLLVFPWHGAHVINYKVCEECGEVVVL